MPGISQPGSVGLIDPTPLIECCTLCLSGQDVTLYLPGSFFATPAMSRDQHGLPCEPASASLSAWRSLLSAWFGSSTAKVRELHIRTP